MAAQLWQQQRPNTAHMLGRYLDVSIRLTEVYLSADSSRTAAQSHDSSAPVLTQSVSSTQGEHEYAIGDLCHLVEVLCFVFSGLAFKCFDTAPCMATSSHPSERCRSNLS